MAPTTQPTLNTPSTNTTTMPPPAKRFKSRQLFKQTLVWQGQFRRPPDQGVAEASLRMKETCDEPSGFCDLLLSEACHCPHLDAVLPDGLLDLGFCRLVEDRTTTTADGDVNTGGDHKKGKPTFVEKQPQKQKLIMANPVHALHMASQLEADFSITDGSSASSSASAATAASTDTGSTTSGAPATATSTTTSTATTKTSSSSNYTTPSSSCPWMYADEQQRTVALSQAGIQETFFPMTQAHIFHQFNVPNPNAPPPLYGPHGRIAAMQSAMALGNANGPIESRSSTVAPTSTATSTATTETGNHSSTTTSSCTDTIAFTELATTPSTDTKLSAVPSTSDLVASLSSSSSAAAAAVVVVATVVESSQSKSSAYPPAKNSATDSTDKKPSLPFSLTHSVSFASPMTQIKTIPRSAVAPDTNISSTSSDCSNDSSKVLDDDDAMVVDSAVAAPGDVVKETESATKVGDSKDDIVDRFSTLQKIKDNPIDITEGEGSREIVTETEKARGAEGKSKNETTSTAPITKGGGDSSAIELANESMLKEDSPGKPTATKDADMKDGEDKKADDGSEGNDTGNAGLNAYPTLEARAGTTTKRTIDSATTEFNKDTSNLAMKGVIQGGSPAADETAAERKSNPDGAKREVNTGGEPDTSSEKRGKDSQTKAEIKREVDSNTGSPMDRFTGEKDGRESVTGTANTDDDDVMEVLFHTKEGHKPKDDMVAKSGTLVEEMGAIAANKESEKVVKPDSIVSKPLEQPEYMPEQSTAGATAKPESSTSHRGSPTKSALNSSSSSSITSTSTSGTTSINAKPSYLLSESRYFEINRNKEQVKIIRAMLAKRKTKKLKKKRKLDSCGPAHNGLHSLPGSIQYANERELIDMDAAELEKWQKEKNTANQKAERWLENFRVSRRTFLLEENANRYPLKHKGSTNFSEWGSTKNRRRICTECANKKAPRYFYGDEVMQCLECSFVGCGPASVCPESKHRHMLQHLFLSGHKFAVTCGQRAELFCFPCGDFVYHSLFDQERERLDTEARFRWLAWSDHPVQRSFDPLQFAHIEEYGIVWRGVKATYPPLVPQEHILAARYCSQRKALFEGKILENEWPLMGRQALDFCVRQFRTPQMDRWRIPAPVGIYNLGNTCFMSTILQCIVHCVPLQMYFLKDIGHNHKACEVYRKRRPSDESVLDPVAARKRNTSTCLACEIDMFFLHYYSNSRGRDVVAILEELAKSPPRNTMTLFDEISSRDEGRKPSGEPLLIAKLLHVAWKSGGMSHLAGYEQRDAHEFLHAFLDILGKQICQHRTRVENAIAMSRCGSRFTKHNETPHRHDVIKHLFEGTLRSVLVCEECGTKRTLSEPFLNVSLHIQKDSETSEKLSVDSCLNHFTRPEKLSDPVDCPSCRKKTPTKKQHTFSRLPRVLCIHLKRFHPALNKKIEDFVSFPGYGLNMGSHLPHWREVDTVPDRPGSAGNISNPEILYDLFGTVNHQGNLSSGHYVSNVKVEDKWFRINDQHVSVQCISEVLSSDGAYILFYARR